MKKMLKIYIRENDTFKGHSKYKLIVDVIKENGVRGTTVIKGIYGYGERGVSEVDIVNLSFNLPVIIECVDEENNIQKIIPKLKEIIGNNGLMCLLDVEVID